MPIQSREEAEAELRSLSASGGEDIDIAAAALLLSALRRPRVPLERYRHHLTLLVRDTADLARHADTDDPLADRIGALNRVFFERYGYSGDSLTYDSLQNANLMRVIDRRKGLPVALGILYLHTARAQGWDMQGLNFPGHFLLRLHHAGERAVIDPFNGGRTLGPGDLRQLLRALIGGAAELSPDFTRPVSNREVLLRLQNNIKTRLLADKRSKEALDVVESMLIIAPLHAVAWREAGILHTQLENLRAADLALSRFLELSKDSAARHEAAGRLQRLRRHLN